MRVRALAPWMVVALRDALLAKLRWELGCGLWVCKHRVEMGFVDSIEVLDSL